MITGRSELCTNFLCRGYCRLHPAPTCQRKRDRIRTRPQSQVAVRRTGLPKIGSSTSEAQHHTQCTRAGVCCIFLPHRACLPCSDWDPRHVCSSSSMQSAWPPLAANRSGVHSFTIFRVHGDTQHPALQAAFSLSPPLCSAVCNCAPEIRRPAGIGVTQQQQLHTVLCGPLSAASIKGVTPGLSLTQAAEFDVAACIKYCL